VSSLPERFNDAKPGEPVVVYLRDGASFAGLGSITRGYCFYDTTIWREETHPHRIGIEIALDYDNLVDVRAIVDGLDFITSKADWMAFFETEAICIPIPDYELIAGAIDRERAGQGVKPGTLTQRVGEDLPQAVMSQRDLDAKTLRERLADMIHTVGIKMGYDSRESYKPGRDSPFSLDVAWLKDENPQIAVQIQDTENIDEALARLRHASHFEFRKAVLVVVNPQDMGRVSEMLSSDGNLCHWVDVWTAESVNKMYSDCTSFFGMCDRFERFGQMGALESR
jgi:hypothetical protein